MQRRLFLQSITGTGAVGLVGNAALGTDQTGQSELAATATGGLGAAVATVHPPDPQEGRLKELWNSPVKDLVRIEAPALTPAQSERHLLYCGLLSALITHYWNGNKKGREGKYPWRAKQLLADCQYKGGDYLGHNIACIAVDGNGKVIDFDFNHNEVFSSSVEHAESRLVRRIFSLTQLNEGWSTKAVPTPPGGSNYSNLLSNVTIYTSLESCSQCSGIMALGSVKEVVFLQRDPGQNSIGNILRNLSPRDASFKAPLPIPADLIGFPYFSRLDTAYQDFARKVDTTPFFEPKAGRPDKSPSITSFLCTDLALDLFAAARADFDQITKTKFPDHKPLDKDGVAIVTAHSNQELLGRLRKFFDYASTRGKRGTPHQL